MAEINYQTGKPVAGNITTRPVLAAPGSYKTGQVLGRTNATGVYGNYDPADTTSGLGNIKGICWEDDDKTLAAQGYINVATMMSEVSIDGLVDEAGDKITLTQIEIENASDNGIVIRGMV